MLAGLTAGPALAQESFQTVKSLYAAAAYEDALAALTRLQGLDDKDLNPEVAQFRVFCLIALGRTTEAEKAIQSLVTANPMYVPDAADVPPRILEFFVSTRRQLLPDIAKRLYADAKAALGRKEREQAIAGFASLVRLVDGADSTSPGALTELRLLAEGFLDLSRAIPEPPKPVVEPPTAAVAAPAPPPELTPPVALKQVMPQWVPPDLVSRQTEFTGSIRVSISAGGKVAAAQIVTAVHPLYDRLLLEAARSWEFQPARRDGVAIPSEQVVQVRLKPR
jgi:protein TonB